MSGRNDDPRAGHPNGHPSSRPNVDPSEMPADLAAVQADDLLLDMLGSAGRPPGDVDGELTRVLTAWRHEVCADSDRLLVDTDTALAVISAARRPIRRRSPVFGPIAAAAAVLVIAFSAVGLIAKSAQPGDNLWAVTEVLYSDYARSVQTAASVRTELEQARTALRQGKPAQARESLDRIQKQLPVIAEAEGKADLATQHRALEQELAPNSPAQGPQPDRPNAPKNPRTPLDSSSSAPSSSTQPDPATSEPTPRPSSEPTPRPSSEPTPSPTPSTEPTYPRAGDRPIPSPGPTPPTRPDDQPTQPSAKPIRSAPSDYMPPAPPKPPTPPSDVPENPNPDVSGGPSGDTDSGYGGPMPPTQPRLANAAQLPSPSETTASA